MRFRELGLNEPIVRAVATEGYTTPTPIQSKAIPEILAGRDVLGCAQTGTGKTGAFALPILHRLALATTPPQGSKKRGQHRQPRAIVLAPTRELATQIFESFKTYGRHTSLRHTAIFGGVNQFRQVRDLRAGVDVIVATPGRLLDLMQQGHVDLSHIEVLVLDEADRMLDMGFIHDIRKVVRELPEDRQTLFFSATMPSEIRQLADSILNEPVFVQAARVSTPAEAIAQTVYMVTRAKKSMLLERLLQNADMQRTLIFTRTKHGADKLVRSLFRAGIDAGAIHSNKSQTARTRALGAFKSGRLPVLVATDIASRGIDVDEISHVVNYDIPNLPETYVHRIGRTARAGASGIAMSFCDHDEMSDLRAIEKLMGIKISVNAEETDIVFSTTALPDRAPQQFQSKAHGAAKHGGGRSRARRSRSGTSAGSARSNHPIHRDAVATVRNGTSRSRGARKANRA